MDQDKIAQGSWLPCDASPLWPSVFSAHSQLLLQSEPPGFDLSTVNGNIPTTNEHTLFGEGIHSLWFAMFSPMVHWQSAYLLLTAWSTSVPAGEVGEDRGEIANATRACPSSTFFAIPCPRPCASTHIHLVSLRCQVPPCMGGAAVPENRNYHEKRTTGLSGRKGQNLGTG